MGEASLVGLLIEDGDRLTRVLSSAGLPIAVSALIRLQDDGVSRLYVASPDVETFGPRSVYTFIDEAIEASGVTLALDDVVAANTTNHFVNELLALAGDTPEGIARAPFALRSLALKDVAVDVAIVFAAQKRVISSEKLPRFAGS